MKKKIQPRSKRPRKQISSKVIKEIEDAIERDAIRWRCSKSWIEHTALAAFYGIDIPLPYEKPVKLRRVK